MKKNRYAFVSSVLLFATIFLSSITALSQTCSGLQATCTTSESRCMATGTITVQVSGGSGNYNYKAVGPVITSFTSSNVITGLQAGVYSVIVRDITNNCQLQKDSIVVKGTYSDPRFILTGTDVTCAGSDGTITVNNQQFGRAPFSYTIVSPSPSNVGTTNTTGFFGNLIAGDYVVQLKDSCGGIQVRRITLQDYSWWFNGVTVTKTDCNNADAVIHLKDNKGNLNTASTAFTGFFYGLVNAPGDTTWEAANSFSILIGAKRSVTFVAKDPCGNTHTSIWNVPANVTPSVDTITANGTSCTEFTATVSGAQNLTNPAYILFDNTNTAIDSNATGVFSNLSYGDYCIHIQDACYDTTIVKCISATPPAPSVDNNVAISNRTCSTFTASITGQANIFNPSYCLYDADSMLLNCTSDGVFKNLPYGSYCIKITDSCTNTVLDRCFTASKLTAVLTNYTISGQNCTSFDVTVNGTNLIEPQYCLYDSLGNVVSCDSTGVFTGLLNGTYCIRAISCGDTTAPVCFTGVAPIPEVAPTVETSNKACTTFTAAVTGQANLTSPQYCLYDSADVLITCNTTGVFDSLAYGSYCIKLKDGCYDTTIVRCFTQTKPVPSVSAAMKQLNSTCSTFTAKVTGQKNLFDALYCIYDSNDSLLQCDSTGVFDNLPYGTYCVVVTDGCTGQTLRICQTFTYNYSITLAAAKSCTIGSTNVDVSFVHGSSPFAITVYDPTDSLVYSGTATSTRQIVLPALQTGDVYTVIGMDNCGRADTATIAPDVSVVTKSITTISKCPSAVWLDGSGDLNVTSTSNLGDVIPTIISKDSMAFSKTYSSNSDSTYTFSDLEPATYVVEYSIQNCSTKMYDTVAVQPYTYPTQGRSAIYQCDNKSINLTAEVTGGVGPYNYQIFGSEPDLPSIVSTEQSSPTFNINTGTIYSLIRLRTVDACGNATLNDVSVLPLQNILITADTTCLFNPITLSVDTIPSATYSWFKKLGTDDSVFLTSDKTYFIPMMQQQDISTYVCKLELNNSCLTRLASFDLTGDCGDVYLPVAFDVSGKTTSNGNVLNWTFSNPQPVLYFEIERQLPDGSAFTLIDKTNAGNSATARYQFTDADANAGVLVYRIKAALKNGTFTYSNTIRLQQQGYSTNVYPNPAHQSMTVLINGTTTCNYRIQLFNTSGQLVYQRALQNVRSVQQRYMRPEGLHRGIYLLKITNLTNGTITNHKLFFD